MIKLYQFPPYFGLPNASPFCLKLEAYLRMAGVAYETVDMPDPRKAPKGKVPYIDDNGTLVADSHAIVTYLEDKYGKRLDAHLDEGERAAARALRVMIEEHLYWSNVYSRFIDERSWPTSKKEFFQSLPPVIRSIVPNILRKQIRKDLHSHGMGRHTPAEIRQLGEDDVRALSAWLGDKPWFTGDHPTELDASAYGMIAQLLWTPSNPDLKKVCAELPNLEAFCVRVRDTYFPAAAAAGQQGSK